MSLLAQPYRQPWVLVSIVFSGRCPGSTFPWSLSQGCCPCGTPGMMVGQAWGYRWSLGDPSFSCFLSWSPDPNLLHAQFTMIVWRPLEQGRHGGKPFSVCQFGLSQSISVTLDLPLLLCRRQSFASLGRPSSVKLNCKAHVIVPLKVCSSHRPCRYGGGERMSECLRVTCGTGSSPQAVTFPQPLDSCPVP